MSIVRVVSPFSREVFRATKNEEITWTDERGRQHTTKYRFQLKNQASDRVGCIGQSRRWRAVDAVTHHVLIREKEWSVLSEGNLGMLMKKIQQVSDAAFGDASPAAKAVMQKQFSEHSEGLESVARKTFAALRYTAGRSSTHASWLNHHIGDLTYHIECHQMEDGKSELFFIGGELGSGEECTTLKMVKMTIPKNLSNQRQACPYAYYLVKASTQEKERMQQRQARLTLAQKEGGDLLKIRDLAAEVKLWEETITANEQLRKESLARRVNMGILLKARRTPHVIEYSGIIEEDRTIVATWAEMCNGALRNLVPPHAGALSTIEKITRVDILSEIAETLISFHNPVADRKKGLEGAVLCACDLKTDNILLIDGHVRMGDLGGIVEEGQPVREFTVPFNAPNKHLETPAQHEDDIFSLALIGFELMHCKLESVEEVNATLDEKDPLDRLFQEMLLADRRSRPTAKDVRERLAHIKESLIRMLDREKISAREHSGKKENRGSMPNEGAPAPSIFGASVIEPSKTEPVQEHTTQKWGVLPKTDSCHQHLPHIAIGYSRVVLPAKRPYQEEASARQEHPPQSKILHQGPRTPPQRVSPPGLRRSPQIQRRHTLGKTSPPTIHRAPPEQKRSPQELRRAISGQRSSPFTPRRVPSEQHKPSPV